MAYTIEETIMAMRIQGIDEVFRKLPRLQQRLTTAVKRIQRIVAQEMFTGIVTRTPVDTGFAMASWRLNTGVKIISTADKSEYKSRSARGQITQAAARTKALSYAMSQLNNIKNRPTLESIFITSAVPYIVGLEKGTISMQAPKGMVSVTKNSVIQKFKTLSRTI